MKLDAEKVNEIRKIAYDILQGTQTLQTPKQTAEASFPCKPYSLVILQLVTTCHTVVYSIAKQNSLRKRPMRLVAVYTNGGGAWSENLVSPTMYAS